MSRDGLLDFEEFAAIISEELGLELPLLVPAASLDEDLELDSFNRLRLFVIVEELCFNRIS